MGSEEILEILKRFPNNETFLSRFYGLICLTPGQYHVQDSEGVLRLEFLAWLRRN